MGIERPTDVEPSPLPMETQRGDQHDDVPSAFLRNSSDPAAAAPASQRIANIGDNAQEDSPAPPKRTGRKDKGRAPVDAHLTLGAQRGRNEITDKSLVDTNMYQPHFSAQRREWNDIVRAGEKPLHVKSDGTWRIAKARLAAQFAVPDLLELEKK
ncbi:unnamed protein product, partial [Prorocentrum cordatum]